MPAISIFDIFKIGVGPSSSHTVGPMKAACAFVAGLGEKLPLSRIQVRLHGSLAYTGKGHGTDSAVLLGLSGAEPATLDPDTVEERLRAIHKDKKLEVPSFGIIDFDPERDLLTFYERQTDTLILRPTVPLRPAHTYAVVLTRADRAWDDWRDLAGGTLALPPALSAVSELVQAALPVVPLLRQPVLEPLDRVVAAQHVGLVDQRAVQRDRGFDAFDDKFL